MKRIIHLGLSLILLLILPIACQQELDELPDFPKERSVSKKSPEEIPKVMESLHTSLGMARGNDQIFSVNHGSYVNDFSIDMDRIMEVIDTTGNRHYSFAIEDNDSNPFIFYNLVISVDQFGNVLNPFLLRYEMSEEFKTIYQETGSIQGFAGKIRRTYLLPSSGGSMRNTAAPNTFGSSAGEEPCDDSEGSGGSGGPNNGGGDPVDNGPTPTDDPDPWGNFGGTPCDIYWIDFASESCGENCVTARQSILVIDCGESDGELFSRAGEDDCNGGAEIVVLDETDPCKTSAEDIGKAFPNATTAAKDSLESIINEYAGKFGIDTKEELQHFLAQAGHETGGFTDLSVSESLYYTSASRLVQFWPKLFSQTDTTKSDPDDYLRNSEKLANKVYGGKYGNGNEASGDGYKYRGRGFFQLTFKSNYQEFTDFYQDEFNSTDDFVTSPDLLTSNSRIAIISAMWFYKENVLDEITVNSTTTVKSVTEKINAAAAGLADRKSKFNSAKEHVDDCDE